MKKRLLAAALSVLMLLCAVLPVAAITRTEDGAERTVVVACSDFQNNKGDAAGAETVKTILTQIKKNKYYADGFICCGDYTTKFGEKNQTELCSNGLAALKKAVEGVMSGVDDEFFVQGNHDYPDTVGLTGTGAHDTEKYGVYLINEDDYMQEQNTAPKGRTVRETADALGLYLADKVKQNYNRPIFVATHLPLAYSLRSYEEQDSRYASYLFDVLDTYAKKGLYIVYLYGHDHSNGWENYLGGSSVCLTAGEKIMIADPQNYREQPVERTLSFTYMNAGYVGYYNNAADDDTENDKALTMTVFSFGDGEMEISRYDENGLHALKSEGYYNRRHEGGDSKKPQDFEQSLGFYTPDKTTKESKTVYRYTSFDDVKMKDWFFSAVDYTYKEKLFSGTSTSTFSPNGDTTRAMLVSVLWRAAGEPAPTGKNPFSDVKAKSWYGPAVIWAAENGIVKGIGEGKFDPDGKVTREQIALILYNYTFDYVRKGTEEPATADVLSAFPDVKNVSKWAKDALCWAVQAGLISGAKQGDVSYLNPGSSAKRSEIASILYRYMTVPAA